jgi:hypothetical protein
LWAVADAAEHGDLEAGTIGVKYALQEVPSDELAGVAGYPSGPGLVPGRAFVVWVFTNRVVDGSVLRVTVEPPGADARLEAPGLCAVIGDQAEPVNAQAWGYENSTNGTVFRVSSEVRR